MPIQPEPSPALENDDVSAEALLFGPILTCNGEAVPVSGG